MGGAGRGQPALAEVRLAAFGRGVGEVLFGGDIGAPVAAAIDGAALGSGVVIGVAVDDGVPGLPVELACLPDGRCPALEPGVRLFRVAGRAVPALAGPLKILVAVAAPEETKTGNAPLDVEAELQAVMDAVADVDSSGVAQVRILEVSGLARVW